MPPALKKHKLQRWTPDTCDPLMKSFELFDALGDPFDPPSFENRSMGGCKLIQYWDSLNPSTPPVIVGWEQICPAHEPTAKTPACVGKLLWHTGNWKNREELFTEQRQWFLWLNHKEWLARSKSLSSMPEQIKYQNGVSGALRNIEPTTPITVTTPSVAEIFDLNQMAEWNVEHNARVGIAKQIINTELSKDVGTEDTTIWSYSGVGDSRVLTITDKDGLTAGELSKIEGAMDVQFGTGKVVVG